MTASTGAVRKSPFARMRAVLKSRPDTEHEMVLNRVVIAILLVAYMSWHQVSHDAAIDEAFSLTIVYAVASWGFFAHLLRYPAPSIARRMVAMTLDISSLSYCLYLGGPVTALLYPAYLWLIFGNGFRFGLRALFISAFGSIAGFGLVILTTGYWADNLRLSIGLLLALAVLPAYAAALIRKLEKARMAAEAANRAKGHFLASVSHELRTPLNAVIGMTNLLDGTKLDAEQRDMARTAGEAGRSLLAMIDELLDFSRLEAGRMPVNPVDFDLHETLAGVRGMLTAQARAKNLRLALHVTPRTPYLLHGEARHIRDVLVNLVGNAIKFTETGGVSIAVDVVGGGAERPRLRFEVADTGIGIAPEARARIFESFTQADESILNSHGGTGLGLAICRQLIELHQGAIGVESEPGVGSTFWFELDLAPAIDATFGAGEREEAVVVAFGETEAAAEALAQIVAEAGGTALPAVDLRSTLRLLKTHGREHARRVVFVQATAANGCALTLAESLRAAGEQGAVEIIAIDPAAPEGLPEVDVRLALAAVTARAEPTEVAAMLRIASVGGLAPAAVVAPVTSARRLSILVADDNRTNQKVIAKVLERAGHEVRVVDNGELALDALTERAFDIVLMDINMPVLDGIECTKLYRFASIGKKRTPIVALTADATPDARERCLDAGMDACLTKPIEPDKLLAAIDEIVGGGEVAGDGAADAAAVEEAVDEELIANIASHPNFRPARRAVVDPRTLAELEELGGREFLGSLIDEFVTDAAVVLRTLHEAMEQGDAGVFREQAHALRSGAANIGARGMYEICLTYRNVDGRELAEQGAEHLRKLEAEFERVKATLSRHLPESGADAGS